MHGLNEFPEVARDHFGRFGRGFRVGVISFVNNHCARAVGDHDAIHILVEVGKLRAAKSTIDHVERLHVRDKRIPKAKTGTSCEDNAAGSWRMDLVLVFKITNGRLPSLRQYARQKYAHTKTKEQYGGNPCTDDVFSRRGVDRPSHWTQTIPRNQALQYFTGRAFSGAGFKPVGVSPSKD